MRETLRHLVGVDEVVEEYRDSFGGRGKLVILLYRLGRHHQFFDRENVRGNH